ncbi:MAG: PilZ domain-containing protein [Myxococcales bacterium]|nr:PilZ domain-containing protein [Myxococcales bacterium]
MGDDGHSEDDKPTVEVSKLAIASLGKPRLDVIERAAEDGAGRTLEVDAAQVVSVERRAHKRVPYDATVRCIIGDDTPLRCESLDLSAGGMLLRVREEGNACPALQSLIEVCLMQSGDRVMTLEADVVRHVDERTFGVRFIDLDKRRRAFVARLVNVVAVVQTGEYGAATSVDATDVEMETHIEIDLELEPPEEARASAATLDAMPTARPPSASLDELGAADDVPRMVRSESIDWHQLDYRMVYLLSLITPAQLTYRELIAQAAPLAKLTEGEIVGFLAELARRGIIENTPRTT